MEVFLRLHILTDYRPPQQQMNVTLMNVTLSRKKQTDFKAEPLIFIDLASHMK